MGQSLLIHYLIKIIFLIIKFKDYYLSITIFTLICLNLINILASLTLLSSSDFKEKFDEDYKNKLSLFVFLIYLK